MKLSLPTIAAFLFSTTEAKTTTTTTTHLRGEIEKQEQEQRHRTLAYDETSSPTTIRDLSGAYCIDVEVHHQDGLPRANNNIYMSECDDTSPSQRWRIQKDIGEGIFRVVSNLNTNLCIDIERRTGYNLHIFDCKDANSFNQEFELSSWEERYDGVSNGQFVNDVPGACLRFDEHYNLYGTEDCDSAFYFQMIPSGTTGGGGGGGVGDADQIATFDDENLLLGRVTVKQTEETQGRWTVQIDSFVVPEHLCPGYTGELNWHIHAKPIGMDGDQSNCGSDVTGGHYDPTYACGPASDFAGPVCDYLEMQTRPGYNYAEECGISSQTGCELGDLSGKMGRVDTTKTSEIQIYEDLWLGPVEDVQGLSVLFHCCTPEGCGQRVACANLEVVQQ